MSKIFNVDFLKHVEITPPTDDGGIDGIVHLPDGSEVYFEAKCKKDKPIPPGFIRNFTGGIVAKKGRVGYYFTTTRYTEKAILSVEKLKDPDIDINITLIDGHEMVDLIFKYGLEDVIKLN
ncbi:restriction endonuclease [Gottfriedia acidiceleris]|uniref:restriction endonuclease n=1 Tax=Gottfriedia acidiceleris TaxID=371036 RepID=UPI003F68A5EC